MQANGLAPLDPALRTVGWVAQWTEMIEDSEAKLMRPRQLFIGPSERHYVPIEQRR